MYISLSLTITVVLLYSACSGYRMLRNHQKSLRLRFSVNKLLINIHSTIRMLIEVLGTLTWFSAIVVRLRKMNMSISTIAIHTADHRFWVLFSRLVFDEFSRAVFCRVSIPHCTNFSLQAVLVNLVCWIDLRQLSDLLVIMPVNPVEVINPDPVRSWNRDTRLYI